MGYTIDTAKINGVLYMAHRGSSLLYPENTITAFRRVVEDGVRCLELDVQYTADSVPVVMHDSTIDRTCQETGSVSSFTAAQWANLHVDHGSTIGGEWATYTEAPPTLEQVISEFVGEVVLCIEIKQGSAAPVIAMLQSYGVATNEAIIESSNLSTLAPVVSAGYPAMFIGTGETPSSLDAAGVGWVGLDYNSGVLSKATITSYTSLGINVAVWTINEKFHAASMVGKGASAVISGDVIWVQQSVNPVKSSTDFSPAEHRRNGYTPDITRIIDGYYPLVSASNNTSQMFGFMSPVGGDPEASDYVCEAEYTFTSASAEDRWIAFDISQGDAMGPDSTRFYSPGFRFLLRKNGEMSAYYVSMAGSTQLGSSVSTAAIANGGTAQIRVTVTPTTIEFSRLDSPGVISRSDARIKGGFISVWAQNVLGRVDSISAVPSDLTAPVLTDATATATGPTTATATVDTDDGNGTLYFLASTNATESAATVKAALSQSVTASGAQSISLSALDPETTYYVHFVQINGAGLESEVVDFGTWSTPDISIPLSFSGTAPATLLTVQVWSKVPKKADVEGLY